MERNPNSQTISWFIDLRKMNRLNLNPEYQRNSVWNLQYRRFFIDTIIRNYPCPTIFLVKEYKENLEPIYGVVDGKQRLTSIFGFIDGEFYTDKSETESSISEKYFNDLPQEIQRAFLDYQLTVEVLNKTTPIELKEAFDRMNRNVAKLNAQELRHARYSGAFINFCETWAQNPWFKESAIATQNRVERMADIEFVSELVVLTERGIQHGKDILDEVYSEYDEEIPNVENLYAKFERILETVKELGVSNNARCPFGKIVDIYGIWAAISQIYEEGHTINIKASTRNLLELAREIEDQSTNDGKDYYINAQRQTNSRTSRQKRAEIIRSRLVIAE